MTTSWLYDLASYALYQAAGGVGLVVAKAVLIVLLALVLLQASRTGSGWVVPATCTALVLLALSGRLQLQPATVSLLLFALALWLEKKRGVATAATAWLPPWPLIALFVLWVNLDGRFLIGLLVVALIEGGRALDQASSSGSIKGFTRAFLAVTTVAAACLVNPAHVYAFAHAAELLGLGAAAGEAVASPFGGSLQNFGLTGPGFLYFVLLALGLASFFLQLSAWSWARFLPWVGLAVLGGLQLRLVPFFVVVAGPILSWNVQDWLTARFASKEEQGLDNRLGRLLPVARGAAVLLLFVLVVCAWPGWLQGPPYEPRRWEIQTPPSLERGAAVVRKWHEDGRLGSEARALHISRDTVNAFAWFCPEDIGVLPQALAPAIEEPQRDIGGALRLDERTDAPAAPAIRPEHLRQAGIHHLVLYDPDRDRLLAALERLLADPRQWPLLCLEGDLAVFGWRDPADAKAAASLRNWELDVEALAFHPKLDKRAPTAGPGRDPEVHWWWEAFWKPVPPRPIDLDESLLYLFHAKTLASGAAERHIAAWDITQSAGLVSAAASWSAPSCALFDASLRLEQLQPLNPPEGVGLNDLSGPDWLAYQLGRRFARRRDDTPPALLYLAIRAARRAIAVNPDDARAYFVLGDSYLRLIRDTRERFWAERFAELLELRRVQASIALNQAIALKPDYALAHETLAGLYEEIGYFDLALQHRRIWFGLTFGAGPPSGAVAEQFREQALTVQEALDRDAKEVARRENSFLVAAANASVADRAALALQRGLGGKARDLLLASDVSNFGRPGMALELELLLRTGRYKEVREWTDSEQRTALGGPGFHWLRAMAFAGSGDYFHAQAECGALAQALAAVGPKEEPIHFQEALSLRVGQAVLEGQPAPASLPGLFWSAAKFIDFQFRAAALGRSMRQEADLTVLRGLLALEQGDPDQADKAFGEALGVWQGERAAESGAGIDFNGRAVAQACRQWLK